jgi:hypothetical protein
MHELQKQWQHLVMTVLMNAFCDGSQRSAPHHHGTNAATQWCMHT